MQQWAGTTQGQPHEAATGRAEAALEAHANELLGRVPVLAAAVMHFFDQDQNGECRQCLSCQSEWCVTGVIDQQEWDDAEMSTEMATELNNLW